MNDVLLTQHSWSYGLLLACLQMLIVVMVCYLRLVVELFRRREYILGVIFSTLFLLLGGGWTIGVLVGLLVGWRNAREWNIRAWMAVWSFALVIALFDLGVSGWMVKMPREQWNECFGWLPGF